MQRITRRSVLRNSVALAAAGVLGPSFIANATAVRRQRFWDNGLGKLREALAHQYCDFRRPAAGAASDDWRWSVV